MAAPVLQYLTLSSIPIEKLPQPPTEPGVDAEDDYSSLCRELRREADILLNHDGWTGAKRWHNDQVTTYTLPRHAVEHRPKYQAEDHHAQASTKKKSGSSWFGSKSNSQDESDEVPIGWWKRTSRLTEQQCGPGISAMWETLGLKHTQQEKEYVSDLHTIHEIKPGVWLKMYNLPFPTTNRCFLTYVCVIPTSKTSFLVIGLPVRDDSSSTKSLEKHHVRGRFVSVEQVREVKDASTGKTYVEWSCVSQSYAAGSIPTSLSESHMASSMASAVPTFLSWLKKRIPDLPKDSHPPAEDDEILTEDKQTNNSAQAGEEGTVDAPSEPHPTEQEAVPTPQQTSEHSSHAHHARISLDQLRKRLSFQLRGDLAQVPAGTTAA